MGYSVYGAPWQGHGIQQMQNKCAFHFYVVNRCDPGKSFCFLEPQREMENRKEDGPSVERQLLTKIGWRTKFLMVSFVTKYSDLLEDITKLLALTTRQFDG